MVVHQAQTDSSLTGNPNGCPVFLMTGSIVFYIAQQSVPTDINCFTGVNLVLRSER